MVWWEASDLLTQWQYGLVSFGVEVSLVDGSILGLRLSEEFLVSFQFLTGQIRGDVRSSTKAKTIEDLVLDGKDPGLLLSKGKDSGLYTCIYVGLLVSVGLYAGL